MKAKRTRKSTVESGGPFSSLGSDQTLSRGHLEVGEPDDLLDSLVPRKAPNREELVADCYRLLDVYPILALGGLKPVKQWCVRPVPLGGAGWTKDRSERIVRIVRRYIEHKVPTQEEEDESLKELLRVLIRQASGTQRGYGGKDRSTVILRATELLARMGGFDKGQRAKSQMHELEDALAAYEGTGAGRSISNPNHPDTLTDTEIIDALNR